MKFNPTDYEKVPSNEAFKVNSGAVQLFCTAQATVFVDQGGLEALVGHGTAFRFTLSAPAKVKVNIVTPGVVYRRKEVRRAFEDKGEIFTNIDKMPGESSAMLEVTKALRRMKLEARAIMDQVRAVAPVQVKAAKVTEPEPEVIETEEVKQ